MFIVTSPIRLKPLLLLCCFASRQVLRNVTSALSSSRHLRASYGFEPLPLAGAAASACFVQVPVTLRASYGFKLLPWLVLLLVLVLCKFFLCVKGELLAFSVPSSMLCIVLLATTASTNSFLDSWPSLFWSALAIMWSVSCSAVAFCSAGRFLPFRLEIAWKQRVRIL